MEREADSDQTVSGRMIDTIQPSTAILIDMITLTSLSKSTRISSEVLWEQKKRMRWNTIESVYSLESLKPCKITLPKQEARVLSKMPNTQFILTINQKVALVNTIEH